MWNFKTAFLILLLVIAIIVTASIIIGNKSWYGGGVDAHNMDNIKSVCLMVGPYRNLTTLLAGVMALHPNVQVMNHGMVTLFKNKENNMDFWLSFNINNLPNFNKNYYNER